MNPQQQDALESFLNRVLTEQEIAAAEPLLAIRNDVALRDLISVGRTKPAPKLVGIGLILAGLAPNGGAFLDTLQQLGTQDQNIKWFFKLIENSELDVGHPVTRSELQRYGALMPDFSDEIATLLAMAEVPNPYNLQEVSDILNVAEGRVS